MMQNVLILNSSPALNNSVSTELTSFFERKLSEIKRYKIITRDLGAAPPSHLTEQALSGFFIDPSEHNEAQKHALKESTTLIKELDNADIIVIGSAMHNHTVTSGLKAYIDQVTRPSLTFKYESGLPRGLLVGKKVFVIISAGGDYSSKESRKTDFVTPLLKEVLGFIGLDDIIFIPVFGAYLKTEVFAENKIKAKKLINNEIRKLLSLSTD